MKATLEQIARRANVSRRTVSRVLNKQGHVKPELERKVQKALEELEYQPNKIASALAYSRNKKKIAILYQNTYRNFEESIRQAIEDAGSELTDFGISVEDVCGSADDLDAFIRRIDSLVTEGVAGFAMRGMDVPALRDKIDELEERGIPVVTFNSDVPGSRRRCYFGQDSYRSGRMAGYMMARMLRPGEKVVIGCGMPEYDNHYERVDGFIYELKKYGLSEGDWYVFRSNVDYDTTYRRLEEIFAEEEGIKGIYMSIEPNDACGDFLRDHELDQRPFVICHDTSDENIHYLKEGIFDLIIDQDIYTQGYHALLALKDYLLTDGARELHRSVSDLVIYSAVNFDDGTIPSHEKSAGC